METSNKSTGHLSSDLMLFVEATPASHSAKQDTDEAQTTQDTCSPGYLKPLADYDPDTQSWRMFGVISLWEEQRSLETLPPSGMTRSGVLYQLPALARHTSENELLLLPTPTAVMRPMEGNVRLYRKQVMAGLMSEAEANAILGKSVWAAQGKLPSLEVHPSNETVTGKINPAWVEWLMGFPIGWTDLED